MKYKIKDTQFADRYWGKSFNSLEEVREQLISYHSADHDEQELRKESLAELCDFCWEIQTEEGIPVDYESLKNCK